MAARAPTGSRSGASSKSKPKSKPSAGSTASRPRAKSAGKRPPPQQVKTKPGTHNPTKPKKKQKVYSDKELNLPTLNMITPAGVQKPRGKKKGKIFVDDRESMMTILAMVNADKEGQIESKMMKARQMEEIREARRKEAEARQEKKNEKLEDVKKLMKKKRYGKKGDGVTESVSATNGTSNQATKRKTGKKVSFA